jgi:hypothetical protein
VDVNAIKRSGSPVKMTPRNAALPAVFARDHAANRLHHAAAPNTALTSHGTNRTGESNLALVKELRSACPSFGCLTSDTEEV